jgi:hypothetical protein
MATIIPAQRNPWEAMLPQLIMHAIRTRSAEKLQKNRFEQEKDLAELRLKREESEFNRMKEGLPANVQALGTPAQYKIQERPWSVEQRGARQAGYEPPAPIHGPAAGRYGAPRPPARPPAGPTIQRQVMQPGGQTQAWYKQQEVKPTMLQKLMQERDLLPQGHSARLLYNDRISKLTSQVPPTILERGDVKFERERKISKEFRSEPEVASFMKILPQYQRVDKAMSDYRAGKIKNRIGLDQALIIIFNKLLDENSVVRESEVARTPEATSLKNRIEGEFAKILKGGMALADKDREELYSMVQTFFNIANASYNVQVDYYKGLSERYGLDPQNIIRLGGKKVPTQRTPPQPISNETSHLPPEQRLNESEIRDLMKRYPGASREDILKAYLQGL